MWAITDRGSLKLITFALYFQPPSVSLSPSATELWRATTTWRKELVGDKIASSSTHPITWRSSPHLHWCSHEFILFRMWWTQMDETTYVWEMNWSNSSRYLLICTLSHSLSILSPCHLVIPRICRAFDINPLFLSLISTCSHLIQVMGQSSQQQATLTHPAYYTQVLT